MHFLNGSQARCAKGLAPKSHRWPFVSCVLWPPWTASCHDTPKPSPAQDPSALCNAFSSLNSPGSPYQFQALSQVSGPTTQRSKDAWMEN